MVLVYGVLFALTAATLIGTGQTVQKYAISRLQMLSMSLPPIPKDKRKGGRKTAPSKSQNDGSSRLGSPMWVLGISLAYLGEVFNWLALGQTSAAVVTPLNVVSVVVCGVLSWVFLGEALRKSQLQGFMWIFVGVFLILMVSPTGSSQLGNTAEEVLQSLSSFGFLAGFCGMFLLQTILIYHALFRRMSLGLLTCICSLFGSIVVCGTKIISSLLTTMGTSSLAATPDAIPTLVVLLLMVIGSVVIQEFFKQEALTRYSVSTFQPIFFAGFNTAAVLSSVVLFREFDTVAGFGTFFAVFAVALSAILYGSRQIQETNACSEGPAESRIKE